MDNPVKSAVNKSLKLPIVLTSLDIHMGCAFGVSFDAYPPWSAANLAVLHEGATFVDLEF